MRGSSSRGAAAVRARPPEAAADRSSTPTVPRELPFHRDGFQHRGGSLLPAEYAEDPPEHGNELRIHFTSPWEEFGSKFFFLLLRAGRVNAA